MFGDHKAIGFPFAAAEEVEMRPFSLRLATVVLGAAVITTLAAPGAARADAVTQWNANANAAISAANPTAHQSVLSSAMVQGAVYDAVNGILGGYEPYLVRPAVNPWDSTDAAVATAAYRVLLAVVPSSQTAALATLAAQYTAALAAVPAGAAKDGGIAAGEAAAAAMLAARTNDGRNPTTPFPFVFGTTPGVWRVTPPLTTPEPTPWVGNVKPFLVPDVEMLRTKGPNDLTSRQYAKDVNEVESIGSFSSTTRTPDETSAAIFWQSPPLFLWGGLERSLSAQFGLSTADNARLFAEVSLAQADAAIGCWNDKYYWNFWRPADAIHMADTDGNPRTTADPNWRPLFDPATPTTPALATPNFPEHPSGHSCLTGATMNVMRHFFGTDRVSFDIVSTRFAGTPAATRHFDSFSDTEEEVINARVWGGIHFRTADEQGAKLGKEVARWERHHYFKRDHH
jgi:PAP2 superfamily